MMQRQGDKNDKDHAKGSSTTRLILKRDGKGNAPYFWDWVELVHDKSRLLFPYAFPELSEAPKEESEEELLARITQDIPEIPLKDGRATILPRPTREEIATLPNATARALASDDAILAMQEENRAFNAAATLTNRHRGIVHKTRMENHQALVLERPKMAAWLISEEVMAASVLDEIKADGLYIPGPTGVVPAHTIMEIVCRVLGGVSKNDGRTRIDHENALRVIRQGSMPTHQYCTVYKRALRKCVHSGSVISASDLILFFVNGLNVTVFENYINGYNADPSTIPTTVAAVMADALDYQQRVVRTNPSLAKALDNSNKAFVAYSTEIGDTEESTGGEAHVAAVSSTATVPHAEAPAVVKCQLCHKDKHEAPYCFKLRDPDFVRRLVEAVPPDPYKRKPRGAPPPAGAREASVSAVTDVTSRGDQVIFESPDDLHHEVYSVSSDCAGHLDLEHDDHAQVSVMNETGMALFATLRGCADQVVGVVPGAGEPISRRGDLKFDMGEAVVIPDASRLLVSGSELRVAYDMSASGSEIRYCHRITGDTLIFRSDPVRFGDAYFHLLINPYSLKGGVSSVSNLDFYDPPPLAPIPKGTEDEVWPLILAVERFHWNAGHMGAEDMKRTCRMLSYSGQVTPEGVDLFVRHRGCSACVLGTMTAHAQLPSTRGLNENVGAVFQGDIFFIEASESHLLVPVLLAVCEASKFMYLHIFVDALARSRGHHKVMVRSSELEVALEGLTSVCSNAGHPMKVLRFDRESAMAGSSVGEWFKSKGVELSMTGAGQKLGLAEVCGRIVKNRCRSTLAGILERFGYRYPAKWIPRLAADIVCILNRTARRGESLSPSQKFFGVASALDTVRDMRAAIGEVLLFKQPQRGASSPISVMKAEWGIVVSRRFDKRGVMEVYLIESKAYGHRFKFARLPVSAFVMDIVRGLSASDSPIAYEPAPPPEEPNADLPLPTPVATDVALPLPITDPGSSVNPDAFLDPGVDGHEAESTSNALTILSAQVTYRRALLESPDRATPAMVQEIKSLFSDKHLGRPVRYADIPLSERKFILRSLDGYKEKYGPDGEWIKSKARIFVDGSKQRPEYTAESSSPVARIESVYMLASIAAFRGWEVVKFDVVSGYPNTPRPPEVLYKYLCVSKEITMLILDMFPQYNQYVGRDGCLIFLLDKMLYGMKEAGYYFYLLMFEMFRKHGFSPSRVDPCVIHQFGPGWEAHGAVSVDDCFFVVSSPAAKDAIVSMFTDEFGPMGFTMQDGQRIDLLGLLFEFDRIKSRVIVTQKNFVSELLVKAGTTKYASSPSGSDLFDVPIDSEPVLDPDMYRSLNQSYAFAASRTYPECLPSAAVYASRFVVATEEDYRRLLRSISYLGRDPNHCLVLHPGSLSLVCSADASYGVHSDGRSHSGICVGFKGCGDVQDSFFIFSSSKQSIVTTSSCEAELVCSNTGASYLVWAAQLLEGFHLSGPAAVAELHRNADITPYAYEAVEVPTVYQDNASAIHLIDKGRGNFRNSKHIRVRYYYIRDLVKAKEVTVVWQASKDMVADLLSKGVVMSVFLYLLHRLIGKR